MNTRRDALKKIHSSIEYYCRFHNLESHPFQIILDWEFIIKSIGPKYRLNIVFSNIFQKRVVPLITKCTLAFLNEKKHDYPKAYLVANSLDKLDCEHDPSKPCGPHECITQCLSKSPNTFAVATQNFNTTALCVRKGNVPIFHISYGQIVMEHPSSTAKLKLQESEEEIKTKWKSSSEESFIRDENKRLHQSQMYTADPKKRARRKQLKDIKMKRIEKMRKKRIHRENPKHSFNSQSSESSISSSPHKRIRKTKRKRATKTSYTKINPPVDES